MVFPLPGSQLAGKASASVVARMVENSIVCPTASGVAVAQVSLEGSGAPQLDAAVRAQSMSQLKLQQVGSTRQVCWQQATFEQPGVSCASKHGPELLEQTGAQPDCDTSAITT
jgi:hypothetical protein